MTAQLTLDLNAGIELGRRDHADLVDPVVCPRCGMHWRVVTRRSWWLEGLDRCYSCQKLDELRPGFAWRCLDCTWRSRARGAVAHEQVRTHHTVTRHALSCVEVLA